MLFMKKTFSFSWPSIRRWKSTSSTNHAQHDCFQHRLSFFSSASCVLHNLHIWRTSPRNPNSGTPFPEEWPIPYPILQGILLGVVWELLDVPGFSLEYTKNVGVFTIWSSWYFTSRAARGGGGSFKNRKCIGGIGCCESRMTKRKHWWIWLTAALSNWLTD